MTDKEQVELAVAVPTGAQPMVGTWQLRDAGNNWCALHRPTEVLSYTMAVCYTTSTGATHTISQRQRQDSRCAVINAH